LLPCSRVARTDRMRSLRATVILLTVGMAAVGTPATTRGESGAAGRSSRPLDLEIGLRGGVAKATGPWSDYLKRPLPFTIEANLGLHRNFTVGGFFRWAPGRLGSSWEEVCEDCRSRVLQTGLDASWRIAVGPLVPWVGAGLGYQWFKSGTIRAPSSNSPDARLLSVFVKGSGVALLAQAGAEIVLSSRFRVGPYLGWSSAWHDLALSESLQNVQPLPSGRSSLWEVGLGATLQVF